MGSLSRSVFGVALAVVSNASTVSSQSIADAPGLAPQRTKPLLEITSRFAVHDVPLAVALEELAASAGVEVAFSPSLVWENGPRVSCDCKKLTVGQVLDQLVASSGFTYAEMRGQIVVFLREMPPRPRVIEQSRPVMQLASVDPDVRWGVPRLPQPVRPQDGPVAGVVLGSRSEPIAGARVVVVGTSNRTETDAAGRFRFASLPGTTATLEVTRIGYRRVTQPVTVGNVNLQIALAEAALNLDAVVVTGTAGAESKRAIGNAVASVSAVDVLGVSPIRGVGDLLNGRVAGVVVTPGSGVAGGGPIVQIRGRSTISLRTQPLVYVDGVRTNSDVGTGPSIGSSGQFASRLGDLNPEEIESIEIIRGPAAATLYGTEASNGVIQIITKKGRMSDRPTTGLSIRQGANWFMDLEGRIPHNFSRDAATGVVFEQDLLAQERAAGRPIFKTGHLQGIAGDISGGVERLQYYLGAGYDRDEGIDPTNLFKRLNARANLTVTPRSAIDLTANLGIVRARRDLSLDRGLSPMFALLFANPALRNTPTRGFAIAPPEAWRTAYQTFQDVDRYIAGLKANHRPTSWLTQRLTVGLDQATEDNQVIVELQPDSIRRFLSTPDNLGRKIVNRRIRDVSTVDYGITATAKLPRGLQSSTSFGAQYYRDWTESQYSEGQGFPVGGIKLVSAAATTFGGDDFIESTTLGFYAQQQISLNDRLFLTGAIRGDDNSAFGSQAPMATYPKVSASWVVSEEPFWKIGYVNGLKLRGAYGQSGLQPQVFSALRTYRPTSGSTGSAVSPQAIGNPTLGPERGEELELGFEADLLGSRLGVDFSYYNKQTNDMILLRDVAPSTGFPQQQVVNAGEVTNKGFELLVNGTPLEGGSVRWNMSVTLSTNDSKIIDLDPSDPDLTFIQFSANTNIWRHAEGYPIGARFNKRIVSATYNPTTRLAENILCDGGPGAAPMPCDVAPLLYIGRPTPKYEGAFTNTFTFFRRLTLQTLVDFKGGFVKFDQDSQGRCVVFRVCEVNVSPEKFDPITVAYAQQSGGAVGAIWYPDATFAKLREVSLSYVLPTASARYLRASGGTVTLAARNLHTWARHYTSLDPESVDISASINNSNYYEQTTTPQLASVQATVRLTW
jgi:TonB-dependent SusC/RagA subfamily outer membrane receptor